MLRHSARAARSHLNMSTACSLHFSDRQHRPTLTPAIACQSINSNAPSWLQVLPRSVLACQISCLTPHAPLPNNRLPYSVDAQAHTIEPGNEGPELQDVQDGHNLSSESLEADSGYVKFTGPADQGYAGIYKYLRKIIKRDFTNLKKLTKNYKKLARKKSVKADRLLEKYAERSRKCLHMMHFITRPLYKQENREIPQMPKFTSLLPLTAEIESCGRLIAKHITDQVKGPERLLEFITIASVLRVLHATPAKEKLLRGDAAESVEACTARACKPIMEKAIKKHSTFQSFDVKIPVPPPTCSEGVSDVWKPIPVIASVNPKAVAAAGKAKKKAVVTQKSSWDKKTIHVADSSSLGLTPVPTFRPPIPQLAYGLDRVLFNPGVYQLQDARTGVYNFDPYLANLMPITEFDFGSLRRYITSSKDSKLIDLALSQGKKYVGSTSSMTAVLSHFHFLLSAWRPLNPAHTTRGFDPESVNFTRIHRAPAAIFLHHNNGAYAIDADKEFDTATVLSMLGQSMEKLLTLPREAFEKYRKSRSHELTEEEKNDKQPYHYTTLDDFMMRSQLDAMDKRLPGTGVFDLKTRAVISIRMDARDIHKGLGYEIKTRFGQWESYEREYYDLVRSAFLKYSLQARMGRMDGIFVAYHNTQRIFGFQYFPISEMDHAVHGTEDTKLGDDEFKLSIHLLNKLLDRATSRFPGKSLRLHFETRTSSVQPFMYAFAKPVTPDEIDEIQNANTKSIEDFERNILGLIRDDRTMTEGEEKGGGTSLASDTAEAGSGEKPLRTWQRLRLQSEKAVQIKQVGLQIVRDAVEEALEESGIVPMGSSDADKTLYVAAMMEHLLPSKTKELSEMVDAENAEDETELEQFELESSEGEDDEDAAVEEDMASVAHSESRVMALRAVLSLRQLGDSPLTIPNVESDPDRDLLHKIWDFERLLVSELAGVIADLEQGVPHPSITITDADKRVDELLGMTIMIHNEVDGKRTDRPSQNSKMESWRVLYTIDEMSASTAKRVYEQVLGRRKNELESADKDAEWYSMWRGQLHKLSRQGRRNRQRQLEQEFGKNVLVWGEEKPRRWEDAFESSHIEEQLSTRRANGKEFLGGGGEPLRRKMRYLDDDEWDEGFVNSEKQATAQDVLDEDDHGEVQEKESKREVQSKKEAPEKDAGEKPSGLFGFFRRG